jgi:alpha-N-arabinofuranosidase
MISQTTITIDPSVPPQPYSRMIFGGFLEHFDRQIYGGVFEQASPLADKHGFRQDVIAALRELKVPVVRWPGGCFVDAYHWQKGVGQKREPYGDFRWGVIEPNTFGTDEFVELCRRIGAEPYICLNGWASVQDNLDWVAYCNATTGRFAEMRKASGHPEPFNVRFWSVGNERYDMDYVNRVRDTAKAMKSLGLDLQVTCAGSQDGVGINSYLLDHAGQYLDYVSIHDYWLERADQLPAYDYLTAITKSELPDAYLRIVIESLRKAGLARIKIAFDEWNLRAWQHPGFPRNRVKDFDDPVIRELVERRRAQNDVAHQYTMADALFAASFLNACLRHADDVGMANIAPLVNTRGPLFVHPSGIVKRTHFHALAMYANLLQDRVARTKVESERLSQADQSVAAVDAVATVDKAGNRWTIALVNRHPTAAVNCMLQLDRTRLTGTFNSTQLSGDSPEACNDIEHPNRVVPSKVELQFNDGIASLPPHSLSIMAIPSFGKRVA